MQGKVCLITGATSGIGRITAQAIAQQGAQVVLVGRDVTRGANSVAQIKQATGNDAMEFLLSAEKGAETLIYLSTSPEVEGVSGKYFVNKREVRSSPQSYDTTMARARWHVSEAMLGLGT